VDISHMVPNRNSGGTSCAAERQLRPAFHAVSVFVDR
jgi:hypothetical protein